MAAKSDAALWVALGVGVVGLGVGVYFLTKSSSSSSKQLPSGPVVLFQPGQTYQFTAALNGLPIDPAFIKNALESIGWTNVSVTSVTPGTYTATGTWSGSAPASLPPGTSATLV